MTVWEGKIIYWIFELLERTLFKTYANKENSGLTIIFFCFFRLKISGTFVFYLNNQNLVYYRGTFDTDRR